MSSKFTFMVYAPDYTDSEAFSRRMAVRDQHLARAKGLLQEGVIALGGALSDEATYQTANKKLTGSMMIFSAESVDAVRKLIEEDIYWKSNVWDKERLVIAPWLPAHPLPKISFA